MSRIASSYLKSLENGTKTGLYKSSATVRDLTISIECKDYKNKRYFFAHITNGNTYDEEKEFENSRKGFQEACSWLDKRMQTYVYIKSTADILQ